MRKKKRRKEREREKEARTELKGEKVEKRNRQNC